MAVVLNLVRLMLGVGVMLDVAVAVRLQVDGAKETDSTHDSARLAGADPLRERRQRGGLSLEINQILRI